MTLAPDHPRMIPLAGNDPAAERAARWARTSVTELEKEHADLSRTWPTCPILPELEAAISAARQRARVYETEKSPEVTAAKEGGSDA
ncbi:hypothetical protein [Methylobacterium nonmethylotrophicum]|uniref:Uncharacterized protein n=1 Tax=Methylobacterium nonmethylotrophicum TaxID=1141884 RepID=A0A4Z0NPC8_9HYPH|nr:hypothetical protein [Methylobacterium nonmethylotrophicum]TGD98068.1 hypothetical protein EU555_18145 [Methylobacterium nonmethylotrophicum]